MIMYQFMFGAQRAACITTQQRVYEVEVIKAWYGSTGACNWRHTLYKYLMLHHKFMKHTFRRRD